MLIISAYFISFLFSIRGVGKLTLRETVISSSLLVCHGSDILFYQSVSWPFSPINFVPKVCEDLLLYSLSTYPLILLKLNGWENIFSFVLLLKIWLKYFFATCLSHSSCCKQIFLLLYLFCSYWEQSVQKLLLLPHIPEKSFILYNVKKISVSVNTNALCRRSITMTMQTSFSYGFKPFEALYFGVFQLKGK